MDSQNLLETSETWVVNLRDNMTGRMSVMSETALAVSLP